MSDGSLVFEYRISIWKMVRWTFDIRMSNIHLGGCQMEIWYSNIEYPSGSWSDGSLIFECQISIWEDVRWMFDISNIEYPSVRSSDGRLIFEYRISIWEVVRWTFDIRISNIHLGAGQMDL